MMKNATAMAKRTEICWKRRVGRWHLKLLWKRRDVYMGRFGGGWNWSLGFQLGASTLILNCLVFSIRIERQS